ncbi:glycosyltransferase [Paenibacillus sp. LMG 31459]|jgi:glycosyltransferase involved in cell wall biosynthesis|uniref:Glycosyltransferase n=1 Tax=Paenibacillus phytohabitans TaxID=2654978 RepID=A0ABX1YK77_9BACL|nr:glycosyl transferase [Paenibacillus sp. FSL P4-0081]NOU81236.1 glycosyltransferase [Paenibacillus phytohabitans]OMF22862.1 glycosyl transferase [Paenibacillus sp. FSL H8-0259]
MSGGVILKVLFTFYVPSGGVETLNKLRCESLQKSGIECHVLYLMPGSGSHNQTNFPVFITSVDAEIKAVLDTHNYDAIIVTSDYLLLERLRRLGYGRILIYESQGLGKRSDARNLIIDSVPFLRSYCNAVLIPPTDHLLELFIEICPWLHRYVIPNIVDVQSFQHIPGEPPCDPVIAWVGRLETNKNWSEYLKIAHQIRLHKPDLHLWMFHDPDLAADDQKEQFNRELQSLGLKDRLSVFTNIPNHIMPVYYSSIAGSGGFLLSSSITEGFGYAVAEAICCTCPVLSTDSDGVRSFITHNITGKFYPIGNLEAAVNEGLELMNNIPLREAIRQQGRQHMVSRFGFEQYAHSFREMMNSFSIF